MKILAIAGSNSENSINKTLLSYAAGLTGQEVTLLDMLDFDAVPLYSPGRQQRDGFPAEIQRLYQLIQAHDGVMLASPEYNGSIPAAFKNVIDWLSRVNMRFLADKPVLVMSTSPGPNGGKTMLTHLVSLLPWWGAKLTGSYSLGRFYEAMPAGELSPDARAELDEVLAGFQAALSAPVLQAA